MINRRALLIPVLAAVLLPAAPAVAGQDLREVAREVRDAAGEAARAVTRYQGNRTRNRFSQTDRDTKTVRIQSGGVLELRNIAGDITVVAGGGDQATIEITKTSHAATDAEARELLGLVQVRILETPGRVDVRAEYPENRGPNRRRNVNVSTAYRVTAPAGTRIRTDSVSGNISIGGIRGDLTLGTISGNLVVREAGRRIGGQTISGNVELVSAQDDAVVELSSTSGNVRAQGIRVRRLDLASISGSVIGRDLRCEQASLHTMSGNVEYLGALVTGGRYEFKTHSGDVRLTLAETPGFELEASTFSGEVRSALKLTLVGTVGSRRNRTIRGTYGDGSARIEAASFSGNVLINGR